LTVVVVADDDDAMAGAPPNASPAHSAIPVTASIRVALFIPEHLF
jgi:hypothetical protein